MALKSTFGQKTPLKNGDLMLTESEVEATLRNHLEGHGYDTKERTKHDIYIRAFKAGLIAPRI
jgi:hypothetical protein